jgi:hypothetical protein
MKKLLTYFAWVILASWLLLIGVGIYWLIYPYEPIVFKEDKFPVSTKEVKQGGNLVYVSNSCKYFNGSTEISRSFINGLVFSLPTSISTRPMGCVSDNIRVFVPNDLPAGRYYLRTRFTYQVNPLRVISIIHETETFEVVE